jgi:hypothetical protein
VSGVVTLIIGLRTPTAASADKPADSAPAPTGFIKDLKVDVSSSGLLLRGRF